jgi:hypothetical protein
VLIKWWGGSRYKVGRTVNLFFFAENKKVEIRAFLLPKSLLLHIMLGVNVQNAVMSGGHTTPIMQRNFVSVRKFSRRRLLAS